MVWMTEHRASGSRKECNWHTRSCIKARVTSLGRSESCTLRLSKVMRLQPEQNMITSQILRLHASPVTLPHQGSAEAYCLLSNTPQPPGTAKGQTQHHLVHPGWRCIVEYHHNTEDICITLSLLTTSYVLAIQVNVGILMCVFLQPYTSVYMVNICKCNSPKVFVQITHFHLFNGTAIWTVHFKISGAAWNHHINGNLGSTSEIATVWRNGICQPHHACNVWLALTVPLWFTCFVMYGWQDATPMEGESLICLEYQVVEVTCLIEQAAHYEFWYECPLEEGVTKEWNRMIKKGWFL